MAQVLTFKLPFPPSDLNPNRSRRDHWAKSAKARKRYRDQCALECVAWGINRFRAERISLRLEFHPPDNRRRDRDNLIAAFKAGQDAIADALGVDDSTLEVSYAPMQPATGNRAGYVIAVLSGGAG